MPPKTTQFQRTTTQLEELINLSELLLNASDLESHVESFETLRGGIESITDSIQKLRVRINEKDVEKQTYGPVMVVKVQGLIDKFDRVYEVFQDEISPSFCHLSKLHQIQKEKQQKLQQDEEKKQKQLAIQVGREETEKEEKLRQETFLEKQNEKLQKDLLEKQARIAFEKAEEELKRRREIILENAHLFVSKIKNTGDYKRQTLEGLTLLASTFRINKDFRVALEPLQQLLTRISRDPDLPYLRVIRVLNDDFFERIGQYPGASVILSAAGFVLKEYSEARNVILQAQESFKARSDDINISTSIQSPDELYFILSEPDSVAEFANWTLWMEQLDFVTSCINRIQQVLRNQPSISPPEYCMTIKNDINKNEIV